MPENARSPEEMKLSESGEVALESLRTRHIPRLEAMLAEQQASGALEKDIAKTRKWLGSAKRSSQRLQKSIQELKKCQM